METAQSKASPTSPTTSGHKWRIDATRDRLAPRRLLLCRHERDSLTANTAAAASYRKAARVYTFSGVHRSALFVLLVDSNPFTCFLFASHLTPWRSLPPPCFPLNGPRALLVSLLQCGILRRVSVRACNLLFPVNSAKNSTDFGAAEDPPNQKPSENAVDVGQK